MAPQSQLLNVYNALINPSGNANSNGNVGGVFPDLALGVQLTGGASWVYGAWFTQAAAASVTVETWVTHAYVQAVTVNDEYQVQLGIGAAGFEVAVTGSAFRAGVTQTTAVGEVPTFVWPYTFPIHVVSGSRIASRVASNTGATTLRLVIGWRTGIGS